MTDLTEVIGEVKTVLMVLEGLVLDDMMTQTTPPGTADVGRRGCCIKYPNIPRMNIFPPVVRIPPHMTVRYLATTYCTPSTTAPLLGVPQGTAINIQNITINKAREQKIKSRGEPPNTQTNISNPKYNPFATSSLRQWWRISMCFGSSWPRGFAQAAHHPGYP